MKRFSLRNSHGFSLLEILIVTAILGTMAVIASQAIKGALQNKRKIDARLRVETTVFDALRLMTTDLEKAFHYQYALYEIDRQAIGSSQTPQNPNDPNPPPVQEGQAQLGPPPEQLTQMIGRAEQLHFTSLNHQRTTANAQESDQAEVGYYLADCTSRVTNQRSKCLWRRSSSIIDNDVTRGGDATALLENVSELKFEYMSEDPNEKEWRDDWLTDNNGGPTTKNLFPFLVKITLEVFDKENKDIAKFRQVVIANVRSPNNVDPAKKFAPSAPANPQNPPGGQ